MESHYQEEFSTHKDYECEFELKLVLKDAKGTKTTPMLEYDDLITTME
jgi:hypothetical protein